MAFDTAANIINDAAVELGLIPFTGKVTDPFASTNPNFGRLCQLTKSVGRDLLKAHRWSWLRYSYTFLTVTNQGRYALPSDYDRFVNKTWWNRTNRLPLGGPLSPQEFEYLKARLVGVVFTVLFEVLQQQFQAYPDTSTPGNYVIAYEYISRWFVVPAATQATSGSWQNGTVYAGNTYVIHGGNIYKTTAGGTSGTYGPVGTGNNISDGGITDWAYIGAAGTDVPTKKDDVIQFPPQLFLRALKYAFLKGRFPADAEKDDYERALDQEIAADAPGPTLNLSGTNMADPLLGERNVPITGFAGV